MRIKHLFICAIICVSSVAFAFAQSVPPPPPPALPTPSAQSAVHVTTRIVQVSVTIHDKDGRPVTGLTKDDFTLLDEGQRQQIASFSEQTNHITTTAATLAPNLFTNRFEQRATAQPPLTVIVLDAFNTRYLDYRMPCPPPPPYMVCFHTVDAIFTQVEKFVAQMQPQDRVALYELTIDKLYLLQDFTSDPVALQQAVIRGKEYVPVSFPPSRVNAADMGAYTMDAMHTIADRLAKIPGRKNFVWLSTGFPPSRLIEQGKTDETAKALGNADLPLSAIDARGLVPLFYGQMAGGGGGGGGKVDGAGLTTPAQAAGEYGLSAIAGRIPGLHDFDFTKDLAETSGGSAFYDTNDFAGVIRKVIDDSASTYILGYYPDHNKWNGEFREIKVRVNRPGLEVRARKGYYAIADTASATERDSQKLADAIKSPLESTDLGFDIQADGFDVAGVRQLKVKITLDANQLRFQQQTDRWTDNISEVWAELDAEGKQVGEISKTIELNRTQDEYKKLLEGGFTYSKTLILAKDAAEVRLVLRDAGNGAIGSVIIPLSRIFAAVAPETKK
ncbi:MAG TPA: VWA domain-containing protein [Candidatus Acidoferrales bacterium]